MRQERAIQTLGQFLKDAREHKGLSLRAVATETGISNPYLSQLEGDKIKQPSPTLLHKVCELYEISYHTAMELAGYPAVQADEKTSSHRNSFAARLGPVTRKEGEALIEYLEFLRSRRKRGWHQ